MKDCEGQEAGFRICLPDIESTPPSLTSSSIVRLRSTITLETIVLLSSENRNTSIITSSEWRVFCLSPLSPRWEAQVRPSCNQSQMVQPASYSSCVFTFLVIISSFSVMRQRRVMWHWQGPKKVIRYAHPTINRSEPMLWCFCFHFPSNS